MILKLLAMIKASAELGGENLAEITYTDLVDYCGLTQEEYRELTELRHKLGDIIIITRNLSHGIKYRKDSGE